jgi:hypothetical protein
MFSSVLLPVGIESLRCDSVPSKPSRKKPSCWLGAAAHFGPILKGGLGCRHEHVRQYYCCPRSATTDRSWPCPLP